MKKIKSVELFDKSNNTFGDLCYRILAFNDHVSIFAVDFINKHIVDLVEMCITDVSYYYLSKETPIYIVKYEDEVCF